MSGVQEEKGGRERRVCKDQGPCFGCLKSGHLSSSCRSRLTCEECGKPHPTLLHNSVQTAKRPPRNSKLRNSDLQAKNLPIAAGYAFITSGNESTSTNESVCGSTSSPDVDNTTSMIVPVVVHYMDLYAYTTEPDHFLFMLNIGERFRNTETCDFVL